MSLSVSFSSHFARLTLLDLPVQFMLTLSFPPFCVLPFSLFTTLKDNINRLWIVRKKASSDEGVADVMVLGHRCRISLKLGSLCTISAFH